MAAPSSWMDSAMIADICCSWRDSAIASDICCFSSIFTYCVCVCSVCGAGVCGAGWSGALARYRLLQAARFDSPGPVRMRLCDTSRELKVAEKSCQSIQKMPSAALRKSSASAMLACRCHKSELSDHAPLHSASEPHGFRSLISFKSPTPMLVSTEYACCSMRPSGRRCSASPPA